jgi:hypothetical protein
LGLTFFGLTIETIPEYRKRLFTQIHEIIFYGNGGYDWGTIYNLSIPLRGFIYTQITEHYKSQQKGSKPTTPNQKQLVTSDGKVNKTLFKSNSPTSLKQKS